MSNSLRSSFGRWLLWSALVLALCSSGVLLAEDAATQVATTEAVTVAAAEAPPTRADIGAVAHDMDVLWLVIAAILVFGMQMGFALVESGLCRSKNVCNILMKNLVDFSVGALLFFAIGYGLMFGVSNGWFGMADFFYGSGSDVGNTLGEEGFSGWGFWFFQCVFCATAATIISGAVAERIKFHSYLIYTVIITGLIYPIFGGWVWGSSGFLVSNHGFHDFAGSTVVHSVGGWAALAGAIVLGPRLGKYGKDGKVRPIPGHNMTMVALGVFILWLGWYGFNPGSTLVAAGGDFARVAVTTTLGAAAGAVAAMITAWVWFKKPDFGMSYSGVLAGLVAITAPCAVVTPQYAVLIGLVSGVILVFGVWLLDYFRVDDPVSAVPVHLMNGIWGTLAVGLFANPTYVEKAGIETPTVMGQLIGIGACALWVLPLSLLMFYTIKATVGLRVSEKEELEGLDFHEHGNEAYAKDVMSGSTVAAKGAPRLAGAPIRLAEEGGD